MHAAIGIGIILFGSWTLNTPVPEPETLPPPPVQPMASGPKPARGPSAVETGQYAKPPQQQRSMTREERDRLQARQRIEATAAYGAVQPGMARTMPVSPTENPLFGTPGVPEMPPAPTPGSAALPAGQTAGAAASQLPNAPTYRPAPSALTRPSAYSMYTALDEQRQAAAAAAYRSYTPLPGPDKVYAGTQVATSGVSPYLQLFRNDTAGGTIDNYSTLVRPQLQQQRLNQQFGTDLFGLQRDARLQQASLQRMQTNVRTLQGVGTPQYYMNTGAGNMPYGNPMDYSAGYGGVYGYGYGYPTGTTGYGYQGYGR